MANRIYVQPFYSSWAYWIATLISEKLSVNAAGMHQKMDQKQKTRSIQMFKKKRGGVCICIPKSHTQILDLRRCLKAEEFGPVPTRKSGVKGLCGIRAREHKVTQRVTLGFTTKRGKEPLNGKSNPCTFMGTTPQITQIYKEFNMLLADLKKCLVSCTMNP